MSRVAVVGQLASVEHWLGVDGLVLVLSTMCRDINVVRGAVEHTEAWGVAPSWGRRGAVDGAQEGVAPGESESALEPLRFSRSVRTAVDRSAVAGGTLLETNTPFAS